ncbi:hypothetical protein [Streptosporangium sp. 'caverna']|uniref:hypothetical protein n=1 Tax=Streptosporangium sp. 'caverna' TaxID=2202249 RepID=UPI0013A6C792|nr:hypothetical protein [Streptosporangium sp. 'caverna']
MDPASAHSSAEAGSAVPLWQDTSVTSAIFARNVAGAAEVADTASTTEGITTTESATPHVASLPTRRPRT